jgi:uncharacterized protein YbaP (TraB family)
MKKIIIALLVLVSVNLTAQNNNNNSLLWKITGNGLTQPSYIFGTIHMIPKKDYFFTPQMQSAFDSCQTLVIEADMFSLKLADQIKLASKIVLPEQKTLLDYMDSAEYISFKQILIDSLGVKEKTLDKKYNRIKPFFLTALLMQKYVGKTKTYEEELYKISKKQKMNLIGLETLEFQMSLADSITIEEQIEGLGESMGEILQYYKMVELYKNQDLEGLYKMAIAEFKTETELEFMNLIVSKRNADWVPKIKQYTNISSCFIAVGTLHLAGTDGVIELLRREGYSVTAVCEN